jgi:hypothetical protein
LKSFQQNQWADGYQLAAKMHFKFPQLNATPLTQVMPSACPEALKLVTLLLQWNPARRPTALQALKYIPTGEQRFRYLLAIVTYFQLQSSVFLADQSAGTTEEYKRCKRSNVDVGRQVPGFHVAFLASRIESVQNGVR